MPAPAPGPVPSPTRMATIKSAKDRPEPESPTSSPDASPEPDPGSSRKKKKKPAKPRSRVRTVRPDGTVQHRRSRDGCYTCRVRRKKCDETLPVCRACKNLRLECLYDKPSWYDNAALKEREKLRINKAIKNIKPHNAHPVPKLPVDSTPQASSTFSGTPPLLPPSGPNTGALSNHFPHTRRPSPVSTFSPPFSVDTPHAFFDATPLISGPQWTPLPPQYPNFHPTPPYDLDVKTERKMYVDGVPTAREETMSTYGAYEPPTPVVLQPSFPPNAWAPPDAFHTKSSSFDDEAEPNLFEYTQEPGTPGQQTVILVEDCDRPLLNHFIDNVAPFIFSVLDVKQKGWSLSLVVLPQLENNPIYLHCCLSTAALHLKVTEHIGGEQIDNDIIRHRAATITSLCEAFADESIDPSRLLEATLGMILFQSSVGSSDDGLPDIPWHAHFQAVATLMEKVQDGPPHPDAPPPGYRLAFNQTLAYWIDILGATALRRRPLFADELRDHLQSSKPSGLADLMGCDDKIMYIISEIACMDAWQQGPQKLNDIELCGQITALGEYLTQTEFGPGELGSVHAHESGAIRPRQLTRNFTAIFRFAARIYLCSLVPDFDRHQSSIMGLVDSLTDALSYVPSGPQGFDRALVWPLLVAGSVSVPTSPFRKLFHERAMKLGQAAEFGSFGRVKELLEEVWRVNDDYTARGEKHGVHWRDVMQHSQVDYLII